MQPNWFSRLALFLAGVLGAGGVAAAAASAHTGDALLGPLALVALAQAPALLAFGLVPVALTPPPRRGARINCRPRDRPPN